MNHDPDGFYEALEEFEPLDAPQESTTNQDLNEKIVEDFLSDIESTEEINNNVADAIRELEADGFLDNSEQIVEIVIAAFE